MTKSVVFSLKVEFGDCDPARIVWFPNYFRWMDAASRNFFTQCGVPPWHEIEKKIGVIGTPLVDTKVQFSKTASYGDSLDITVKVTEWRNKSFVMDYTITRGDDLILSCQEVRIFAQARVGSEPGDSSIRAVAIPTFIKDMCDIAPKFVDKNEI
jgi:4-hydroxybenzoyl-CoA thioesterase